MIDEIRFFLMMDKIGEYILSGKCSIEYAADWLSQWINSKYYENCDPRDYQLMICENRLYIIPSRVNEPIRLFVAERNKKINKVPSTEVNGRR